MSFSNEIKTEAVAIEIKKTCCRKAFALGLFMGAKEDAEQKLLISVYTDEILARTAADILARIFRVQSEQFRQNVAGRIYYGVKFFSPAIADFLRTIEKSTEEKTHKIAGFRCENCVHAFLRGSFIACGSISDPTKVYHAELIFPTLRRAEALSDLLNPPN